MIFKDHKVTVQQVVRLIPENLLSTLAINTKVDYCAKVLQGERLFYLLLYAIVKSDRLSQRFLEDVFKSPSFKFLFNYSADMKVSRSSISEKLSKINLDFFRLAYEKIYERYNQLYSCKEQEQLRLIRVDSSMVAEAGTKLRNGMKAGTKSKKQPGNEKKQVKYTMAYDGSAICLAQAHFNPSCLSEDIAIPSVLSRLIKADKEHKNIYTFDRGVSSLKNFDRLNNDRASFVGRIKTNRKKEVAASLMREDTDTSLGSLELVSDEMIHLFDGKNNSFSPTQYRIIVGRKKILAETKPEQTKGKTRRVENEIHFITNDFGLSPQEIADIYKKRWDIEVFFRFIKQELNFKHFLSVNENGLQVMLYMTLITAMLLMVYKRLNEIGFTTAKRRFSIELEDAVLKMAILFCGGDIEKLGTIGYRKLIPK